MKPQPFKMFNGTRVFISEPVKHTYVVERTWKERLLTRPWKPFQKEKSVTTWSDCVPDGEILTTPQGLVMTLKTWNTLNTAIK